MHKALAFALLLLLVFGCVSNPPAQQQAPAGNVNSVPSAPSAPAIISKAAPPPAPAKPADVPPTKQPSSQPAAQACDDSCLWLKVKAATDKSTILPMCGNFSSDEARSVCVWFSAGLLSNKTLCEGISPKYRPLCIQEQNGQFTCSPSQCANCLFRESCNQFDTCVYIASAKSSCSQSSALANKGMQPAPPPPWVH